jgi:histidinol dehydrogenase
LSRPVAVDRAVRGIIAAVRRRGDAAIRELTRRFDGARRRAIEVSPAERREGEGRVEAATLAALQVAARRIAGFARLQKRSLRAFRVRSGSVTLEQRLIPIDTVGVYVPGGRYPLCSSVLMGAIPARVAGCRTVVLCTPPRRDGGIAPGILAAARIAGIDRVFAIGGAQAIAAMAIGTRSVPRCDMVVGPGNRYVAAAKEILAGEVGIDCLAGPSELLVIADAAADPRQVAADLIAQAEHDPDARLWLVVVGRGSGVAAAVRGAVAEGLRDLPPANRRVAGASLRRWRILTAGTIPRAAALANRIAPEHLSIQTGAPRRLVPRLRQYGSLFVGGGSAVAFGDYLSGPNHVLPTGGAARHTGGLSALRFLKVVTVQEVDPRGARRLAPPAERLARMEGLAGHALSARLRSAAGRGRSGADIRAVLFDFDGVLADSETGHWRAFRAVLAPLGMALTRADYNARYLVFDDRRALAAMLRDAGRRPGRAGSPSIDSLVHRKRAHFRRLMGGAPALEPGAARLIRALARRVPLAVVSGAAGVEVRGALRAAGVLRLFRTVVAAENVPRSKPDPAGYRLALRRLGLDDGAAGVALEDSPGGIRAARSAGLPVLGVATTYGPADLRAAGAVAVVPHISRVRPGPLLRGEMTGGK